MSTQGKCPCQLDKLHKAVLWCMHKYTHHNGYHSMEEEEDDEITVLPISIPDSDGPSPLATTPETQ